MLLYTVVAALSIGAVHSEIQADEAVDFFPTCGHFDPQRGVWVLPVHGVIYRPATDRGASTALTRLLQRSLGLNDDQLRSDIFRRRIAPFLADHRGKKNVSLRLGSRRFTMNPSGSNGHFFGKIELSEKEAGELLEAQRATDAWLRFEAIVRPDDRRRFAGRVQLISPAGTTVVSDVDDTIKASQVADRSELLRNTFLREFRATDGMAAFYRKLAQRGATFHYVSASPWQLQRPLAELIRLERFPAGSFHLRHFRLKDSSVLEFFSSPEQHKQREIQSLLAAYPLRRFILVGDSSERDPEIYGLIARKYPRQIASILIRNSTGEDASGARFRRAFDGIDATLWRIFTKPSDDW